MTETPLTMPIDMSTVVAATDCPHYINQWEAGSGATTCAWCVLRPLLSRSYRPKARRVNPDRWITSAAAEEEAA